MTERLRRSIADRIAHLSVWRRGDERAPHKPLLLLLAISKAVQGCPRLMSFAELDEPLRGLLERYGPPRKSYHPEYPFWYLQNDGLWEIPAADQLPRRRGGTSAPRSVLLAEGVVGGLPEDVYQIVRQDPVTRAETAHFLLEASFPASLHEDILAELGLPATGPATTTRRDARFREMVLRAYEHRCAVCGYDVRFGQCDLALEAAHIKWCQARGPNEVRNGLALCAIHHKAFDRGAIGLSDDLRVLVSSDLYGQGWASEWFLRLHDQSLRSPQSQAMQPSAKFVAWHQREVFRAPARDRRDRVT